MVVPTMNFTLPTFGHSDQNEMNLIALGVTVAVFFTSFTLSSCRARLTANTHVTDLTKRLEAAETANAICIANLNALMLNLAALHKARVVRNDTKRRYNDTPRNRELISALHRAEMNYKQAKDNLSSYVIEATQV